MKNKLALKINLINLLQFCYLINCFISELMNLFMTKDHQIKCIWFFWHAHVTKGSLSTYEIKYG